MLKVSFNQEVHLRSHFAQRGTAFHFLLALLFLLSTARATTPGTVEVCRLALLETELPSTLILVAPVSGALGLVEDAMQVFPDSTDLIVLLPKGKSLPPSNARIRYASLPAHSPHLPHATSLKHGVNEILETLGSLRAPVEVITGAESGVDWGLALRSHFHNFASLSPLSPSDFVSKIAIRRFLQNSDIPHLQWPEQFDESVFDTALRAAVEHRPDHRFVVKLDNSSGMNGLLIVQGRDVFQAIDTLLTQGNKHGRAPRILVEAFIDDIALPLGAVRWKEIAFDAVAYPNGDDTLLKFFSAWSYKKDQNKMYLDDTLTDPNRTAFVGVREAVAAVVNALGYRAGAIHFEVYVAVDGRGEPISNSPVILGDPNFRFGGDNRYARFLYRAGEINTQPNSLLLLSHFAPEVLHRIEPTVREGNAKVYALSFSSAPRSARFSKDPSHLLEELRSLKTYHADTIEWTSENYLRQRVGRAVELPEAVEVLLIGSPEAVLQDEWILHRIEEDLARLMTPL